MNALTTFLQHQAQSQFVGGGLVLMFTGSLVALCRSLPTRAYVAVRQRLARTITVDSIDPLFDYVTYWLNSQERFTRSRFLKATTHLRIGENQSNSDGPSMERSGNRKKTQELKVFFSPSHGRHFFRYGGIWIAISRGDKPNGSQPSGSGTQEGGKGTFKVESYSIEGYGKSDGTQLRDLIDEIIKFGTQETEGVRLYYQSWGNWASNGYQKMRPLNTVVLPQGLAESIMTDMVEFRGQRQWFTNLGIPWHRGYLFHGLPGSGKSSLAAALAGELDMDVYLLSLSGTGMNDERLQELMASVRSGCMVVIEDIDCTVPDRDAAAANRVTLSGLLNCLDGIMSREGCLIVMTTNRREVLDAALIRPGRVDMEVEFGYADHQQIVRLAERIGVGADGLRGGVMTMAEVQKELLERYRVRREVAA